MTRIISSLILVIGLALVFASHAPSQLPANTCYFGVSGTSAGAALPTVCTPSTNFAILSGQSCLPAVGFVLRAELPNGNCLPVSVYAPSGSIATLRQEIPGFVFWDQNKLNTKPCPSYWTPEIPCITIAKNIPSGIESSEIGVPIN